MKKRSRGFSSAGILAVFLLLGLLTGCRGPQPDASGEEVLRVGSSMQIRRLNPLADYSYNILAMLMTHDTLVRLDPELRPVPQLARSWKVSEDGRVWEFELVSDASWHDGRPVTADDVAFTFTYLAAHDPAYAWLDRLIAGIETDGNTVTFRLKRPASRFLVNCGFIVRILPRHVWETIDDPRRTGDIGLTLGCGPYVFRSFDRRAGVISFAVNEAYYGPQPAVKRVDFELNRNMDLLALSLLDGTTDVFYRYASGCPAPYVERLSRSSDLVLEKEDAWGVPAALGFNPDRIPLDDVRVRRALAVAVDYERMVQSLCLGRGRVPTAGFVPAALPGALALPPLMHDTAAARKGLVAAGFSERDGLMTDAAGHPLTLRLLVRSDLWGMDQAARLLVHDLRQAGVTVEARPVDLSGWIDAVRRRDYDLVLFRTTPWGMVMGAGWGSGYFDARRGGGGTLATVDDPAYQRLLDRIQATPDEAAQLQLAAEVQRYHARELPAVALCWGVNVYPRGRALEGCVPLQLEGGLINRITLGQLERTRR